MLRYFFVLIFAFSFSQDTLSGYLRLTEMSFCMDDCSQYYLETEFDSDFEDVFVTFDDYDVDLNLYLDRFVELTLGNEVNCIECSAFSILRINLSQDCTFPVDCIADPCEYSEECQINTPVDCIPNYCGGCYADFYDLDNNLIDCFDDDDDNNDEDFDCSDIDNPEECLELGCDWEYSNNMINEGACFRPENDEDEEGGISDCLSDCDDLNLIDPEIDPNGACDWIISNFGPNNFFNDCAEDCSEDTLNEINQIVDACYSCLEQDNIDCADLFDDQDENLECSDYDNEYDCRMNECEWINNPTGLAQCVDPDNIEPLCEDISDLFFGWCEMVIGVGWNGDECVWVSGCGTIDENGIDYSNAFFNSFEDCEESCANNQLENGFLSGTVEYVWGDAIEMVAGANVQISSANGFFITETNDQGYYAIELPQGQYSVTVSAYNETQTQNISISSNQDYQLNFLLGEWYYPSVLMGRVLCEDCDDQMLLPILEADILVSNSNFSFQIYSDNEGYFFIELPVSGDYSVMISKNGYSDYAGFVSVQGYTEMNFYLNSSNSGEDEYAMLSLENIATSPGSEIVQSLFLESDLEVGGLQFTVSAEEFGEYILEADIESMNDCFSASSNYIDGTFIGIVFSLEGCTYPPNEQIHIANLRFYISENTPSGTSIFMDFESTLVSDAIGNEILSYGEGALISVGILGDVNLDTEINILDVISIVNFAIYIDEPNNSEFWAADLNSDNMLDILDIVIIVNIILDN